VKSGARTESHDGVLAVALDEMGAPLAGIDEDKEVDRERDHFAETEVEFVEGNGVDVVVAYAELRSGG
jgi:hypothetical protein